MTRILRELSLFLLCCRLLVLWSWVSGDGKCLAIVKGSTSVFGAGRKRLLFCLEDGILLGLVACLCDGNGYGIVEMVGPLAEFTVDLNRSSQSWSSARDSRPSTDAQVKRASMQACWF